MNGGVTKLTEIKGKEIKVADLYPKHLRKQSHRWIQMVPMDLNIGFQGLALIQGQIYNPGNEHKQ